MYFKMFTIFSAQIWTFEGSGGKMSLKCHESGKGSGDMWRGKEKKDVDISLMSKKKIEVDIIHCLTPQMN